MDSNKVSIGSHIVKVLVQLHYSATNTIIQATNYRSGGSWKMEISEIFNFSGLPPGARKLSQILNENGVDFE